MTFAEARIAVVRRYETLWGEEWMRTRTDSLFTEYHFTSDNKLIYRIIVDENSSPVEPVRTFEEWYEYLKQATKEEDFDAEPNHRTEFLIDLSSGSIDITEHF